MAVYFLLIWTFFIMVHNILDGVFKSIKDGFWGYYEKLSVRIRRYSAETNLDEESRLILKSLSKQQKEIEDTMSLYVFFRFCEKLSLYMTQIDMVVLFCLSLIAAVFVHSALLARDYFWLVIFLLFYIVYMWNEISGEFLQFEFWAINVFLKQYKILEKIGNTGKMIEDKKGNKKIIRKLYAFFILPVSLLAFFFLFFRFTYPLFPPLSPDLQGYIAVLWGIFILSGGLIVVCMPAALNRLFNAYLHLSGVQFKDSYYSAPIYIFLSLLLAMVIAIARYTI